MIQVWSWYRGRYGANVGICNLLRPLIKILFFLVPYGYIIIKMRKNSEGDDRYQVGEGL